MMSCCRSSDEGAALDEVGAEARQQLLEDLEAAGEQAVGVAALRHALAVHRLGRHLVAVDDGHAQTVFAQDPGGEQPGDAAADDDGVFAGSERNVHTRYGVPPRSIPRSTCRSAYCSTVDYR